jgi:transmembrane sensor
MDHKPAATSDAVTQQAADWVLRLDRGLTPSEQDAFSSWLAVDPRHGAALARQRQVWRRLDRLADWRPEHGRVPNPDLLAPRDQARRRPFLLVAASLAAAAALALAWISRSPAPPAPAAETLVAAAPAVVSRMLPDGSTAELNRGARLTLAFTPAERRVLLEQGEAHFSVTSDPSRPFVVAVRGIEIRAVGTAFNVRLGDEGVEVLVTEGRVQVVPPPTAPGAGAATLPLLGARERLVFAPEPSSRLPQLATLTPGEVERVLAWQHRMIDFNAVPLADVVAEFNRRNATQIRLRDPELGTMPVSASFRSDNVEGLVALLEAGFGLKAEWRGTEEVLLRR